MLERRRMRLCLCVAFVMVVCSVASADDGFHVMKKVQIIDQHGFEKPTVAGTMLIPKAWSFESNIVWSKPGGCGDLVKITFRATSPDGKTAAEAFPSFAWQWADAPQSRQFMAQANQQGTQWGKPPCELYPLMPAADFIEKMVVPKIRQGAHIGAVAQLDAHAQLLKQTQQQQAQFSQMGIQQRLSVDDARVQISYDVKGTPVDEWVTAILHANAYPTPVFNGGQMVQAASYGVNAQMIFALRAPQGQLEANKKLFDLIIGSIKGDPQWQARVAQVQGNIAAVNQKGEADRARIRQQSAEDVRQIQHDMNANQQRAQDKSNAQFDQYVRGVESYRDPHSGEQVELPSQYGHAWSNGNGEYIVSDSPAFDPNAHVQGNWQQLQQVK